MEDVRQDRRGWAAAAGSEAAGRREPAYGSAGPSTNDPAIPAARGMPGRVDRATLLLTSWGRGNGHTARLLQIGGAFAEAGWNPVLYGYSNSLHLEQVRIAGWTTEVYPPWAEGVDPWFAWSDRETLERAVALDREVLRRFAPSFIVNDCRIPMVIAALAEGIPFVSVCQDNQVPGYCYDGSTIPVTWTAPVESINAVLDSLELEPIVGDARWLFARGRMAVPSTPELEPITSPYLDRLDLVHTGLLNARSAGEVDTPSALLFYRTVGSIDGEFRAAFADWPGPIYIATGSEHEASRFERDRLPGVNVQALWNLDAIGPELRAIVHHGGHGVTLRGIADGIPAVILPGPNPERSANGRRAELSGAARVMKVERNAGPVWGPAVDETGDRPTWSEIRRAIDGLPPRQHASAVARDGNRSPALLVELLTAPSSSFSSHPIFDSAAGTQA
ncbi:hypothetical protein [Curtobacterium poinsettiae]|uniref:hypothetical protein n=1 Tax=Curtobacterium poinsettiae TaxID=159612 RepID=UPI0021C6AE45|nr:hypothetical protein [Curtobacterium flaccumfaciens]MCU0113492.1 hypothetical protein [Curtobacterium flaccumfaciens]